MLVDEIPDMPVLNHVLNQPDDQAGLFQDRFSACAELVSVPAQILSK
jgi:hypothetical protein